MKLVGIPRRVDGKGDVERKEKEVVVQEDEEDEEEERSVRRNEAACIGKSRKDEGEVE